MFKLQRLEISGFKSFADPTEIVFTGNGITAVVGPNGCGKSNVSDAISWVLGEQRAKSLRGGEMKDVIFAGTRNRKPGGMAEVVLHLVRDDSVDLGDDQELDDIDETLSEIDDHAVDMAEIEGVEAETETLETVADADAVGVLTSEEPADEEVETVKAAQVGSAQVIETTKIKTKRHWRPRSFALDFAPGEAVSVTRRLYLSGESEYQLNGKTCRLRDISDLFAGTGLSGSHYAIIEQGRIGQILSSKPADRRNLIEEAAGISKFRTRQRAAESRLETARANLGRITDIVSEVDKQVNSLRRQAAKTRRFKILQEEYRLLLRQLFAAEGRHYAQLSEELSVALVDATATENALVARVAEMEELARESTIAARQAEESLSELRRIHSNNALERDRAEREHIYKSEQVVNLNNRIDVLRGEITSSEERLSLLSAEIERLREDDAREAAEHQKTELALHEAENAHLAAAQEVESIEKSTDAVRAELMQHTAAAERFDEIARQLGLNLERLTQRSGGLETEARRAEQNLEEHKKQAEELAETLAAEERKLADLTAEKEDLQAATVSALETLRSAEAHLDRLNEEHSAKRHRLATLLEIEEKRTVYTPQVQKIFSEQEAIGVTLAGVLADRLNVDEASEAAVEMLFGEYLQAVVVNSFEDAARLSDWIEQNGIGRTAILVAGEDTSDTSNAPGQGTIASKLGADPAILSVLRDVFPREMSARFVDDLDNSERADFLVDKDANFLLGGRLFVRGGVSEAGTNTSLLAFKRELGDLERSTAGLAAEIEQARLETDTARTQLAEHESQMVDLQSLMIKVDRGVHGLHIQVRTAREEIERATRHRKVVGEEAAQTNAELEELRERRDEALEHKKAAETAREEASQSLDTVAQTMLAARGRLDEATSILSEKRLAAATSGERRRSVSSALRRVENESREIESRLALQKLESTEADAKLKALHAAITDVTDRIASAGDEMSREAKELEEAIHALAAAREASDTRSGELADLNRQTGEARNSRAEIEIRQAEASTQLRNISEHCQQELGTSLSDLTESTEIAEEFVLEDARRQGEDLRQRLENFGAINMLALEELGEAEERLTFLTGQRQDIVESIAGCEEALREIKVRSRERFRSAFEAINANFKEFFQELFGGGSGEMTLLEADDILEAGIEVVAQPPGKRLQNIMLLSGGEKAMTAIALVMSIFKYRPSPFCLLDEVDAPLDDANVGRFAAKIADMSEKTQFIVITHNKRTMESARALYGVTMQEPGVSKIVSVKFE
jgi:chromosome segregation protein